MRRSTGQYMKEMKLAMGHILYESQIRGKNSCSALALKVGEIEQTCSNSGTHSLKVVLN